MFINVIVLKLVNYKKKQKNNSLETWNKSIRAVGKVSSILVLRYEECIAIKILAMFKTMFFLSRLLFEINSRRLLESVLLTGKTLWVGMFCCRSKTVLVRSKHAWINFKCDKLCGQPYWCKTSVCKIFFQRTTVLKNVFKS